MAELKSFQARDRAAWRAWLKKNHAKSPGVWLLFRKFHKRDTGKPSVTYAEALDEALCFGWIDSIVRRVDDRSYMRKFTPRRDTKNWSALNLAHMRRLIASGSMREAGLHVLGISLEDAAKEARKTAAAKPPAVAPQALLQAISTNARAESFWQKLAPGFRRRYIGWILDARQESTRARRIAEVVRFLAEGKKSVLK